MPVKFTQIPYDAAGRRLPIGKSLAAEYDWQVGEGSNAPSWATVTGTLTYSTLRGNPPGLATLTTPATINTNVSVFLTPQIESLTVQSIEVLVDGLRFDVDSTTKHEFLMLCSNSSLNRGMFFHHPNGSTTMKYRMYNAGTGNLEGTIPYALNGGNKGDRPKSIGMVVSPRLFGAYFLNDDSPVCLVRSRNKWVNGPLTCGIQFVTREAAAHSMSFSRLRIRVYV